MKKKLIVAVILTICLKMTMTAMIPVIDYSAIKEEAAKLVLKIKKWKEYIDEFEKVDILFKERFKEFKMAFSGFKKEVIEMLKPFFDPKMLEEYPYWSDMQGKDTWSSIWKNREKVFEKYPVLKDMSAILKNLYYRLNDTWKKFQNENIKIRIEYITDLQELLVRIGEFREFDRIRKKRVEVFQEKLKEWGLKGKEGHTPTSDVTRMIAIWAEIRLEKLLVKQELLFLVRSFLERDLKTTVIGMDFEKRRSIMNKERHKINIREIIK